MSLYLGVFAAVCSTFASLPQLVKSWKKPGSTQELNSYTLMVRTTGALAWAVYAGLENEYILMISSILTVVVELMLGLAKVRDLLKHSTSIKVHHQQQSQPVKMKIDDREHDLIQQLKLDNVDFEVEL